MKLLVIGPEVGLFEELCAELSKGFSVHYCRQAEKALGTLQWLRPDALLVDFMAPGLGGPSFLEKLRGTPEGKAAHVFVLAHQITWSHLEGYFRDDPKATFLAKPANPVAIRHKIHSTLVSRQSAVHGVLAGRYYQNLLFEMKS